MTVALEKIINTFLNMAMDQAQLTVHSRFTHDYDEEKDPLQHDPKKCYRCQRCKTVKHI